MFGIPGKGMIKVVVIVLAKGIVIHGVVSEQKFFLDSSFLPLGFYLCTRFSYIGCCDSSFFYIPKLLSSSITAHLLTAEPLQLTML